MKNNWIPYKSNWRDCQVGDKIITVNEYLCAIGGLSLVEAGESRAWKVIELKEDYVVAKCDNQRMVFCDDFVDENDVMQIATCFAFPNGMELKHYIEKKRDGYFKRLFRKLYGNNN